MIALSAVSSWSTRDDPRQICRDGVVRCGCERAQLSDDQRRIQVLEAEAELRRLRDRVRKAVTRFSAESDRPVKRSRLHRQPVADTLIDVRWNVTAEQLAEHLCYWRHTSALSVVHLTNCLKELTPRSLEPPASKRALTLVWWEMEDEIERALESRRLYPEAAADRDVVHITISDIVPLFVWEVDLLRARPETRLLCRRVLEWDLMDYQRRCGALDAVEYLKQRPLFGSYLGLQACLCFGCELKKPTESTTGELEQEEQRPTCSVGDQQQQPSLCMPLPLRRHGGLQHPIIRRRRLDESLITEPDASRAADFGSLRSENTSPTPFTGHDE